MTGLINSKVRSILGVHKQGAFSVSSEDKTDIPTQTRNENSVQKPEAEKPHPENSEIRADANQSQPIPSAHPIHEVKATQSAFVEKYEMGSGKDKINVRIFKEPSVEPVTIEHQKSTNTKQMDADTVVIKLKEGLNETPVQPPEANDPTERVIWEE